jgi:hypothetical protein
MKRRKAKAHDPVEARVWPPASPESDAPLVFEIDLIGWADDPRLRVWSASQALLLLRHPRPPSPSRGRHRIRQSRRLHPGACEATPKSSERELRNVDAAARRRDRRSDGARGRSRATTPRSAAPLSRTQHAQRRRACAGAGAFRLATFEEVRASCSTTAPRERSVGRGDDRGPGVGAYQSPAFDRCAARVGSRSTTGPSSSLPRRSQRTSPPRSLARAALRRRAEQRLGQGAGDHRAAPLVAAASGPHVRAGSRCAWRRAHGLARSRQPRPREQPATLALVALALGAVAWATLVGEVRGHAGAASIAGVLG